METIFEIYNENNNRFIRRKIYPKFTAKLGVNINLHIELQDLEVDEEIYDSKHLNDAISEGLMYVYGIKKSEI